MYCGVLNVHKALTNILFSNDFNKEKTSLARSGIIFSLYDTNHKI